VNQHCALVPGARLKVSSCTVKKSGKLNPLFVILPTPVALMLVCCKYKFTVANLLRVHKVRIGLYVDSF
jgi:hypothetical protein